MAITSTSGIATEEALFASLPAIPPLVDVDLLSQEITAAKKISETLRLRDQKGELIRQHSLAQAEVESLTLAMAARLKSKEDAISRAEMPIRGLSFGEDGVMFNGVPFEQCSQAEQLVVSTVIGIALNPKLRVIRIQDGSLLDEHNLGVLRKLAEQHDAQLWIEAVVSDDPCAVHIEDGSVVGSQAVGLPPKEMAEIKS